MSRRLELIVKLTERCNIACSYCYYFENEARSALTRPARLLSGAATALADRVHESFDTHLCDRVRVIFHGGEPLLFGKKQFEAFCALLREKTGDSDRLEMCIQTNAMLVDEEWIALFERFEISVGVSIDGPSHVHDAHRVDKRGRPTHARTLEGVRRLQNAADRGRLRPVGALIVLQTAVDPISVYNHVVRELGISELDFLLPDFTCDHQALAPDVGDYLCKLFDHWISADDPAIRVRILRSTLSMLLGGPSFLGGFGPGRALALTILSDGSINGDDFLRPCGDHIVDLGMDVFRHSLREAIVENERRLGEYAADDLPDECTGCAFERICCGGQLTHRYSKQSLFNNRSVYCEGLKTFYTHVCKFLVSTGVRMSHLESVLRHGRLETIPDTLIFDQIPGIDSFNRAL